MELHPSTHPPLPPTTEDERLSWLRLLRSYRVGISTFYRLLNDHGTAHAALDALPEIAAQAGVPDYRICPEGVVAAELRAGRAAGARLIYLGTPDYPTQLLDLADPPPMLWLMGRAEVLKRPMIAIVGARNASSLGLRMARGVAEDLAAGGYVVVSGLARGIDAAAHQASLATGGVAVMAGGVDALYPAENAALAESLLDSGVRVSEMPMGLQPQARHFPRRNRIIAGLGRALVVVEAAAKSGSLLTARAALDQGREVLAVPGHPFDARAAGCNMLIRDGALLVRSARDVLDALPAISARQGEFDLRAPIEGQAARPSDMTSDNATSAAPASSRVNTVAKTPPVPPPDRRSLQETAQLHTEILGRLGPAPMAEDQLIRDLARAPHLVTPEITRLELDGRLQRQAGGLLALAR
ncbi:DNA protecting protein DprA [Pseudooceanicola nitratireducens]|uniref:DNA protecting protein DprA n=1 Tax=Pseudooceanicola nitratireducens TaxID=517719 RepID=A0A1I1N9M5_9RHOB|nr:DNA processing protein [Pseudooceanicola nitratireducens]SFC94155.1 DNA protecting protein DprA [Pseudooceanicola nitratireducens]